MKVFLPPELQTHADKLLNLSGRQTLRKVKKYLSFDGSKKTSPVFGHYNSLPKAKIPVGILYLALLQHLICCLTASSHVMLDAAFQ